MTMASRPTLRGTFGMVSSTHWLASQSAMAELEAGGNAFDAAVAAGFVLHVVEPHLNGPGGEVPAIFATAGDATPTVLCGQGPAPGGATLEHYTSLGLDLIPGNGPIAAAVPGAVDAWLLLLRDHGTRRLRDVLSYAIGYARDGQPFLPRAADLVASMAPMFTEHWPTSAAMWLRGGKAPGHWERWTNPEHADVLEGLVTAGEATGADREGQIDGARTAWGQGFVAEAVDRFQRVAHRDASGSDHAGLVTADDMAGFAASYEPAVLSRFRDVEVAKTDTWGQGPVLLQSLAMLDGLPDAQLDPSGVEGVHTITEVLKLAFADREAWYGDASDVPVRDLLDPSYVALRRELVAPEASHDLRPGSPGGREPRLASHVRKAPSADVPAGLGEPTVSRSGVTRGDTCHVDVVDRWGNIISATPSGGWLQSSPAVPGLGFCLGSRMQMFWLEEGLPATVGPGRRPRTTLSPTLVLREGTPVMACGTPGGDQQDQWQLLFLLRHLVGGQELQEAIDAPTWHTTSLPGSFFPREMTPGGLVVEDRLGDETLDELTRRGHVVTRSGPWSLGRMCAVTRDPASGDLAAGANPRGEQGYACGR
ncbi:MAG: gamma-glutamyltranspeptidase / glutathione hydrolase [Actinomycetota bacterium]|nr:gamma-glutamyltranspeptidase / glutathione hydrolase [Actinomycetota bacterium]